jgi:hypothetical protein
MTESPSSEPSAAEFRFSTESESERLREILAHIQRVHALPPAEQRQQLEQLIHALQQDTSNEDLRQLLDALDAALLDFMGDPRRFVSCISQILSCLEHNSERTQLALQRYVQDRQIGSLSPRAPFDWTMVDILLSQLSHLSGDSAIFTREMRESIVFALFHPSGDGHFLQDLVSQFLLLSVGEQIMVVRSRMRWLSEAPLRKVTLLSNMVIEIHERYEKDIKKLRLTTSDESIGSLFCNLLFRNHPFSFSSNGQ